MGSRRLKAVAASTGEIAERKFCVDLCSLRAAEWGIKHDRVSGHVLRFRARLGGQQRMVYVSAPPELHVIVP